MEQCLLIKVVFGVDVRADEVVGEQCCLVQERQPQQEDEVGSSLAVQSSPGAHDHRDNSADDYTIGNKRNSQPCAQDSTQQSEKSDTEGCYPFSQFR